MSIIAVIDDEDRVRSLLTRCFADEGHRVVSAGDGRAGLALLAEHEADLVLLDLLMPEVGGMQVLSELRSRTSAPPVMVLSAVDDIGARVRALDQGAVDFLTKPFHLAELVARARRHLTAAPTARRDPRYLRAGGVDLDLDRRRANVAGKDVVLSTREFALLAHLMRRGGEVCRRDELLHDVWGFDFDPGSNVLEVCVGRIRHKLKEPPIETVRGVGYCFYGA